VCRCRANHPQQQNALGISAIAALAACHAAIDKLPCPTCLQWRTAVNSRMDELVAQARQRQEREAAAEAPPRSQAETVGLKFI